MRINHNIGSMITQNALGVNNKELGKNLEKLSTGLRINRASDDAAGLSVSEQMRTQVRGLNRAKANAEDGIALLQIAEGAANEMSSMLQRMRELAIQSANDTLTTTDRSYVSQEFQSLQNEIDRISNSAQYNGQTLLLGAVGKSFGSTAACILHIGANNKAGTDSLQITIDSLTTGSLAISSSGTGQVGVTTQAAATSAISSIDDAIKSVNNMRSDMGAYINRLDHAIATISNMEFNTQDAEARIRDVDFATETTSFTKHQILTQSATSMLAQANQVPQSVLGLLG
jgi:flagellin